MSKLPAGIAVARIGGGGGGAKKLKNCEKKGTVLRTAQLIRQLESSSSGSSLLSPFLCQNQGRGERSSFLIF